MFIAINHVKHDITCMLIDVCFGLFGLFLQEVYCDAFVLLNAFTCVHSTNYFLIVCRFFPGPLQEVQPVGMALDIFSHVTRKSYRCAHNKNGIFISALRLCGKKTSNEPP